MKNNTTKNGRTSTRSSDAPARSRDLFDEDTVDYSTSARKVRSQKPKKRSMVLPVTILVLAVTLASLLAVIYFHQKGGGGAASSALKELKTEEQAQLDDYTTMIESATKPADWSDEAFNALKSAALEAYDRSTLDMISSAESGDSAAKDKLKDVTKAAPLSEKAEKFKTLFSDLNSVPASVANLANRSPEMVDLILSWPTANKDGNMEAKINTDALQDLKTANPDWGFVSYGDGIFLDTGAAPTAISEVFSWLLKDPDLNPLVIADFARQYEYDLTPVRDGDSIFAAVALNYGVPMNPLPGYKTQIGDALAAGDIVIAQQGDNENPHFIVLTGIDENGNWIVQDPTSASGPTATDPDSLIDTITAGYAYWV